MHKDSVHEAGGHRRGGSAGLSRRKGKRQGLLCGSHAFIILLLLVCSLEVEVAHPVPARGSGDILAGLGISGRGASEVLPHAPLHDDLSHVGEARARGDDHVCVAGGDAEDQDADAMQRGWVDRQSAGSGLRARGRPGLDRQRLFHHEFPGDVGGGDGYSSNQEVRMICTIYARRTYARMRYPAHHLWGGVLRRGTPVQ